MHQHLIRIQRSNLKIKMYFYLWEMNILVIIILCPLLKFPNVELFHVVTTDCLSVKRELGYRDADFEKRTDELCLAL